jgi:uncharacterized protein HemY
VYNTTTDVATTAVQILLLLLLIMLLFRTLIHINNKQKTRNEELYRRPDQDKKESRTVPVNNQMVLHHLGKLLS